MNKVLLMFFVFLNTCCLDASSELDISASVCPLRSYISSQFPEPHTPEVQQAINSLAFLSPKQKEIFMDILPSLQGGLSYSFMETFANIAFFQPADLDEISSFIKELQTCSPEISSDGLSKILIFCRDYVPPRHRKAYITVTKKLFPLGLDNLQMHSLFNALSKIGILGFQKLLNLTKNSKEELTLTLPENQVLVVEAFSNIEPPYWKHFLHVAQESKALIGDEGERAGIFYALSDVYVNMVDTGIENYLEIKQELDEAEPKTFETIMEVLESYRHLYEDGE